MAKAKVKKSPDKKSSEEAHANILECYKNLFRSDLGKKVLADMKQSLGYGDTLYQENQTNQDLSFHLGRQSVINMIVKIVEKP